MKSRKLNHSLSLRQSCTRRTSTACYAIQWQAIWFFAAIATTIAACSIILEVSSFSLSSLSFPDMQQQQQLPLHKRLPHRLNNNDKFQRSCGTGRQDLHPTTEIVLRSQPMFSVKPSLVLLHSFFQDKNDLTTSDTNDDEDDNLFVNDPRDQWYTSSMTTSMISAQAAFIPIGVILATVVGIDLHFLQLRDYDSTLWLSGVISIIPLVIFAIVLDAIEDRVPALQEVSEATLRSVYNLLGGSFKPLLAIVTAVVLGTVAGVGEEILFRGILQETIYQQHWISNYNTIVSIVLSSIIFGLFHAVTPMYVVLATIASMYFGTLYTLFDGDLTIPVLCHSIYDIGALMYAHYTVSKLSFTKLQQLIMGDDTSSLA